MTCKIGIDFHGVISAQPEDFAVFCRKLRERGILVYIISGGPEVDIVRYLEEHGIGYDYLWTILEDCDAKGQATFFEDGSFWVPTEIWNRAKAEYCAREGIDFHIDDSGIYGRYFVTPYCHYDLSNNYCSIGNELKIDFAQPEEAADNVATFLLSSQNRP